MFLLLFWKRYNGRIWETAKGKLLNQICYNNQILPAKSIWLSRLIVLLLLPWQDKPPRNRPGLQKLHHLAALCRDQSFTATHRFEWNEKGLPEVTTASTAMPTGAPEWFRCLHLPTLVLEMVQSAVLRCSGNTFPFTVGTHSLAAVLEPPWGLNWLK